MKHEELETLSAYIDDEVVTEERFRIDEHLESCPTCKRNFDVLEAARRAITRLDDVAPTAEESRAIRRFLLDYQGRKRRFSVVAPGASMRRWQRTPVWGFAGVVVLVVTVFALSNLPRPGNRSTTVNESPKLSTSDAAFAFADPQQTLNTISSWEVVKQGVDRWKVQDVGTHQQTELAKIRPLEGGTEPQESGGADGPTVTTLPIDRQYPAGSYRECMGSTLKSQKNPTMPIAVRKATYKKEPAWLMVYVWSTTNAAEAPLDRVQFWLVSPQDCRVLHYGFFKPPSD